VDVRNDLRVREINGTSSPGTGAVGARGVHETSVGFSHVLSLTASPSLRLHDSSGT
jgi:hypothetical protein